MATPTILDILPQLPDRFRCTLGLDEEGRDTPPDRPPHPLVVAGAVIPSGFTLVVVELTNRRNPGVGVDWIGMAPRFGRGNYYATVSIPGARIVRGQELYTNQHFDNYTANSILYEAPQIPWLVPYWAHDGGLLRLPAKTQPPGALPPPRPAAVPLPPFDPPQTPSSEQAISYANPMELILSVTGQERLRDGRTRIWLQARLMRSFERNPDFRVAVEADSGTQVFDTGQLAPINPAPWWPAPLYRFCVDLPIPPATPQDFPEDKADVTVVASWWAFDLPTISFGNTVPLRPGYAITPFLQRPPEQRYHTTLFASGASTLGDKIRVYRKRPERSLVIVLDASRSMRENGKMKKAKASAERTLRRLSRDTEVALIVFYDCDDIRVARSFTTDVQQIIDVLRRVQPSGGTPLAAATAFASRYLRDRGVGKQKDLIILSDGQKTCAEDRAGAPLRAAAEVQQP